MEKDINVDEFQEKVQKDYRMFLHLLENFKDDRDILNELLDCLENNELKEDGIEVKGYTAKRISELEPNHDNIAAPYFTLVNLRHDDRGLKVLDLYEEMERQNKGE